MGNLNEKKTIKLKEFDVSIIIYLWGFEYTYDAGKIS